MSTNLVIYLARIMGESPAEASIQQMVFEGTCYLTPLLGAWLADSHWGRYKTILVFSIIYFVVGS
jgi:dipeptide/tripeptide permease